MRIAVTYENGDVYQHFGHSSQFKLYEVEDGRIVEAHIVDTEGQGHGALASFLTSLGVHTVIAGGIGDGNDKLWPRPPFSCMAVSPEVPMRP